MLEYIKAEANRAYTENGAAAYATTHSSCLDLFGTIGALRAAPEDEIIRRFQRAFHEDPDLAMKILFFARDIRGGLGERKVFRVIVKWLAAASPVSVRKNLHHIVEFGRWDDLLILLDTPCGSDALNLIRRQLEQDRESLDMGAEVSLLAKWLPSVNASDADTVRTAKRIARFLKMDDAAYRRLLTALRRQIRIIENHLRERDYTFDYAKQPSRAMYKYRKAFLRNDGERYRFYLEQVSQGAAKLNTGVLTPYDIIAPIFEGNITSAERKAMDTTWNAQADFAGGEHALVVIDGSGSMYSSRNPRPAAVALSLGIYFAEQNTGVFRDHFITFSEKPRLVKIKGSDICEKVSCCRKYNEVANTNIQKVFELILKAAVKHKVPQTQMPAALYIISDMEFDRCTAGAELTNFEYAKKIFAEAGYRLPRVIFWNVASRSDQQPVTVNEQGVALVSGCSPRIFSMLNEGALSPMGYMMEILNAERYSAIAA